MTKSTITREQVVALIAEHSYDSALVDALEHLLAAMESEPVELPLDYLQGHKDGLEWAAQLAEANHPQTGDWLYDDPIELSKAIRKGPDMPPVQPVADSEPVAWTWHYREQWHVTSDKGRAAFVAIDGDVDVLPLYRHAQPAPVVPAVSDDIGEIRVGRLPTMNQDDYPGLGDWWVQLRIGEDSDEVLARVYGATPQEANNRAEALACRAAMLQAEPVTTANKLGIPDGSEDTKRLNWLDAQNKRLNEYYGTSYGWKFDANFQRNAMMLNDSNYPVMTVRQAIDEAIAAAPQEVKGD
ncbi:hypothetical protein MXU14_00500 [Klebsiella pneumoniae]|nr:hypothetical protein [Klebsiella pneumoniae]MDG0471527.1 hypothetical protein [Klebsiella pneumoniae]